MHVHRMSKGFSLVFYILLIYKGPTPLAWFFALRRFSELNIEGKLFTVVSNYSEGWREGRREGWGEGQREGRREGRREVGRERKADDIAVSQTSVVEGSARHRKVVVAAVF